MALYRVQGIHAGYWRGQVKRWNVTSHYSCSDGDATMGATIADYVTKTQALGASNYPGGLAEVKVYNKASGGVPIASLTRFDWATPASWIAYTGTVWGGGNAPLQGGELCADFRTQAGLSKSGKPRFIRWFWHAACIPTGDTPHDPFPNTTITAANTAYNAFQTLSANGSAVAVLVTPSGDSVAGAGALEPFVGAHQRVRGRRRSKQEILKEAQQYGAGNIQKGSDGKLVVIPPTEAD